MLPQKIKIVGKEGFTVSDNENQNEETKLSQMAVERIRKLDHF